MALPIYLPTTSTPLLCWNSLIGWSAGREWDLGYRFTARMRQTYFDIWLKSVSGLQDKNQLN